jgi:hypothetical protein
MRISGKERKKMGRYKSHEEFGSNAPINYREDTTQEVYLKGLEGICPPGMKPKMKRGQKFEEKTGFKASALWHRNFDRAMFGNSDLDDIGYQSLQEDLEQRLSEDERKPRR